MLLLLLLLIPLLVNCNLSRLQWLLDLLARDCCVMLTPVCNYCLNVSEERENVQIHVLTSHCYTCLFAKLWF